MNKYGRRCAACKRFLRWCGFGNHKYAPRGKRGCCKECEIARSWDFKKRVFAMLGSVCVYCGETDLAKLSLGHINHDGADHRRELIGRNSGATMGTYKWVRATPLKIVQAKLQVECINCNWKQRDNHNKEQLAKTMKRALNVKPHMLPKEMRSK